MLLALTDDDPRPFQLVVADLSAPAFLQPPVPEGDLGKWIGPLDSPSAIDLLVTSKNHDVKMRRVQQGTPDAWCWTLVCSQTFSGFLGRGNYGVVRMNGGFGNRPSVAMAPSLRWSARLTRDVPLLLKNREKIADDLGYLEEGGAALLWTLPWDGSASLSLADCDPFFIEICRRVRLVREGETLRGFRTASKAPRVLGQENKGVVGDPWIPVDQKPAKGDEPTALTLPKSGFDYRRVHDLLFRARYRPGVAGRPQPGDPAELRFIAWALVRGQGSTDGLHERVVPVPGHIRARLADPEAVGALGSYSQERIEIVQQVQRRVLKPALIRLLQPNAERLDLTDGRVAALLATHDAAVDDVFFEELFADAQRDAESEGERTHVGWTEKVLTIAEHVLNDATQRLPMPTAHRYRAIASAESLFRASRYKHFGPPPSDSEPEEETSHAADGS